MRGRTIRRPTLLLCQGKNTKGERLETQKMTRAGERWGERWKDEDGEQDRVGSGEMKDDKTIQKLLASC